MQDILNYLKGGGERLDSEIAAATGLSLAKVRQRVKDLQARGEVMVCRSIRYVDGKEVEGVLCRVAGYIPPAAPGRKAKGSVPAKAPADV
jgi:DNA-binding Lrp family transcriptional regulator